MKIHYLQQVPFESPGYIIEWMQENGHQVSFTHFYEQGHQLPKAEDIDGVVIMGGPMNVEDENIYPWLRDEKDFISACIKLHKKVLGICLGAQLIASCLGAKMKRAPEREIGWFRVSPTSACRHHPVFYELFKASPIVFHWHGDQFEIPQGGSNLLDSPGNTNQACICNDTVLGLQFHLEVDEPAVNRIIEACGSDLDLLTYVQSMPQLVAGTRHCATNLNILNDLLNWFFIN